MRSALALLALGVAAVGAARSVPSSARRMAPAPPLPRGFERAVLRDDVAIDCAVRSLAYNFSLEVLPDRAPLVSVFDALQLGSYCNMSRPAGSSPPEASRQARASRAGRRLSLSDPASVFVDPVAGSDSNSGSQSAPFKTIVRALAATRSMGVVPRQIVLRAGTHALTETMALSAADSLLSIVNFPGEEPVVSGGVELDALSWQPYRVGLTTSIIGADAVTDEALPGTSVPGIDFAGSFPTSSGCAAACANSSACTSFTWHDNTQGEYANQCFLRTDGYWSLSWIPGHVSGQRFNVWVADTSAYDLEPFAQLFRGSDGDFRRAMRARYPSANLETTGLWTDPQLGFLSSAKSWLPPPSFPQAASVFVSTPERNNTHFPNFNLGIGGPVSMFNPPQSYWGTPDPVGGGGSTYAVPSGVQWDPTQWSVNSNWSDPEGAIVYGFHSGHWGSWVFSVDEVDSASQTIHFGRGGFQEARGSQTGAEFAVENLLEELDSPNEWFFDAANQKLYFYFNLTEAAAAAQISAGILDSVRALDPALVGGDRPVDPANPLGFVSALTELSASAPSPYSAPFTAAQLAYLVTVLGSSAAPVVNVTLSGLTFAHSDATFLADYLVPSGGDWALHRGAAVRAEGVENFVVESSLFRSPGGNALLVGGYARNTVVSDNEFVYVGDSAIVLLGDVALVDGTLGQQPEGTLIARNLIHEIGIYVKQTAGVFLGLTPAATLESNIIFNLPRAAVNVNDGFGGGHRLSRNLFFNAVRETADHGPFNSWDRQPYLTTQADGVTPSLTPAVSHISGNFLIANYHSVWPLDHDDGSCFYNDTGNVLAYGGFKNYLGHNKVAVGNVYIYPDMSHTPPPPEASFLRAEGAPSPSAAHKRRFAPKPIPTHSTSGIAYATPAELPFPLGGYFTEPYCANSDGQGTGSTGSGFGEFWMDNTCFIHSSDVYAWGTCQLEDLRLLIPFTASNRFFVDNANPVFNCGGSQYNLSQWQSTTGFDLGSTTQGPASIPQIIATASALLNMTGAL